MKFRIDYTMDELINLFDDPEQNQQALWAKVIQYERENRVLHDGKSDCNNDDDVRNVILRKFSMKKEKIKGKR